MSWYAASWTACGGDRPRPLLLEAHGAGGAPSAEAEDRGNSHCKFATSTSRFLEGRLLGQSRKRVKLDGETPSASSDSEHDILEPPEIEPRVLKQMEEIVQKSGDR